MSEDDQQDDDDYQNQGGDRDGASVQCGAFPSCPPVEASIEVWHNPGDMRAGAFGPPQVARTNDRPEQADYAGVVTSSDLHRNTGESSVERSIMVVRSTHEGHTIHRN